MGQGSGGEAGWRSRDRGGGSGSGCWRGVGSQAGNEKRLLRQGWLGIWLDSPGAGGVGGVWREPPACTRLRTARGKAQGPAPSSISTFSYFPCPVATNLYLFPEAVLLTVDEVLEPPFCSQRLFLLMSPATMSLQEGLLAAE